MANWAILKAAIASVIKTNGNQEITGQFLQNTLNSIVSSVGANATFAGIATPTTNPGTPDGPVFYLATEAGVYANFNGIEIATGEAVILEWRGSWIKKATRLAAKAETDAMFSKLEKMINYFPYFNQVDYKQSSVNNGESYYGYAIKGFNIRGIYIMSSGVGNEITIKKGNEVIKNYSFANGKGTVEYIYFDDIVYLDDYIKIGGKFLFSIRKSEISYYPTINNSKAVIPYFFITQNTEISSELGELKNICASQYLVNLLKTEIDNIKQLSLKGEEAYNIAVGSYTFENPFSNKIFNSKTSSDYPTLYSYSYYGFNCKGIKIKSTNVGDYINIYSGKNLIKTHIYTTTNEYEKIFFDSDILVTEEKPLYVQGAFYFFNESTEEINGINSIMSNKKISPIHVNFWFLFNNEIHYIKTEIEQLNEKISNIYYNSQILKVSKTIQGCYTTINEAVKNAKDDENTPVIILIYPGEYLEEVNALDHPNLSFIGINKETCIIKATSGKYNKDPLRYDGIGLIANLSVYSTHDDYVYDESTVANIKNYCLHIDNQIADKSLPGILTVENCYLYCEQGSALGMGARADHHVKIINCEIDVNVPDWNVRKPYGGIYMHSCTKGAVDGQKLTLIGNVVKTNTKVGITVVKGSVDRKPIYLEAYNNISYSSVNGHKANIDATLANSNYGNSAKELNA